MPNYRDGQATGLTRTRLVDGVLLGSRAAAAAFSNRHVNMIRRRCEPIACDVSTHAYLYDLDAAASVFRR